MSQSVQRSYCPMDYNFQWTPPKAGEAFGWYEWDRKAAHSAALKARNAEAKRLAAKGYLVRKYSQPDQLITNGGIGTPNPEISHYVTIYCLDANEQLTLPGV